MLLFIVWYFSAGGKGFPVLRGFLFVRRGIAPDFDLQVLICL